MTNLKVPFFRPQITDLEVNEVVATLRSGWLTSGPKVRRFEEEFAAAVGARYAAAVNSCTAALHLPLGLKAKGPHCFTVASGVTASAEVPGSSVTRHA